MQFILADAYYVRGGEGRLSLEQGNTIGLEESLDAAGVDAHHLVLAFQEPFHIEFRVFDNYAELFRVLQLVIQFRGMYQRLGGNAPDVQAHPAQWAPFDHRRFRSALGSTNRRHIPAGTRTDDYNIKFVHFHYPLVGVPSQVRRMEHYSGLLYRTMARPGRYACVIVVVGCLKRRPLPVSLSIGP